MLTLTGIVSFFSPRWKKPTNDYRQKNCPPLSC